MYLLCYVTKYEHRSRPQLRYKAASWQLIGHMFFVLIFIRAKEKNALKYYLLTFTDGTKRQEYNSYLVLIVQNFSAPFSFLLFFFFLRWQGHYSTVSTYQQYRGGLMVSLVLVRNVKVVPIISARKRMVICHCVGEREELIQQNITLRTWLTLSRETEGCVCVVVGRGVGSVKAGQLYGCCRAAFNKDFAGSKYDIL